MRLNSSLFCIFPVGTIPFTANLFSLWTRSGVWAGTYETPDRYFKCLRCNIVLSSYSFALPMYLDSFVLQTRVQPGSSKVEIKRYGPDPKFCFFITNVVKLLDAIFRWNLITYRVNKWVFIFIHKFKQTFYWCFVQICMWRQEKFRIRRYANRREKDLVSLCEGYGLLFCRP